MDILTEAIQPYVVTIVTAIIGFLAYVIIATINALKEKVAAWFEARTTESQRETLHRIAAEGYAYAERFGQDKLNEAVGYVIDHLNSKGIKITVEEVQAAVQKAWYEYDKKNKVL